MKLKFSKQQIRDVNDSIGLGKYGRHVVQRYFVSLNLISPYLDSNSKVLEIGPGGIIACLSSLNIFDCYALVNPREICWDCIFPRLGIPLVRHDLNNHIDPSLSTKLNQFDLIIFYETLEHLNRWPEFVICDIHKLLKNSGVLSISVPNLLRATNRFRSLFGLRPTNPFKYTDDGMYHVREYCFEEIIDFFPSDSWELLEAKYINKSSKFLNALCLLLPGFGRVFGDVILFNFKRLK